MTRMEAIRKQYQGSEEARPQQATCGHPYPARPRHRFWLCFWGIFLALLIVGFLIGRQPIMEKAREFLGKEATPAASAVPAAARQGAAGEVLAEQAQQGAKDVAAVQSADEKTLKAYVNPSMAEMNQLCEYVRNSPNVRENAAYNEIMSSVQFFYPTDNHLVNAFASIAKLDEKSDKQTRVIVFLGGAARFARVASLAVGLELTGEKGAGKRFVAALKGSDFSKFDDAVALRVISDAGLAAAFGNDQALAKAKSVSAGLMLGIIAHEAGHQALNHTLNTSGTVNLEISRNQEREADSFSSSVIASSPFGEYILVGTLFWHYALAMQQGDTTVATTHPLSKERFENFVRANAELAASMGISLPSSSGGAAASGTVAGQGVASAVRKKVPRAKCAVCAGSGKCRTCKGTGETGFHDKDKDMSRLTKRVGGKYCRSCRGTGDCQFCE